MEHFELFPETFWKLLIKQKLQCYVVIGQKIKKIKSVFGLKISREMHNYEPRKFRKKNWVQKLHDHGVSVYFLLFVNVPWNKIGTF